MAEVSGGLGQQRNDIGDCASMRERVESPGTYVTEEFSRCHFCLAVCSVGPPSRALVVITCRGVGCRYMMRLVLTVKMAQLLNTKAQMSSIWAKGFMLMIMCVLTFHLTRPPLLGGGRKSWYIIIISKDCKNKIIKLRIEYKIEYYINYGYVK